MFHIESTESTAQSQELYDDRGFLVRLRDVCDEGEKSSSPKTVDQAFCDVAEAFFGFDLPYYNLQTRTPAEVNEMRKFLRSIRDVAANGLASPEAETVTNARNEAGRLAMDGIVFRKPDYEILPATLFEGPSEYY